MNYIIGWIFFSYELHFKIWPRLLLPLLVTCTTLLRTCRTRSQLTSNGGINYVKEDYTTKVEGAERYGYIGPIRLAKSLVSKSKKLPMTIPVKIYHLDSIIYIVSGSLKPPRVTGSNWTCRTSGVCSTYQQLSCRITCDRVSWILCLAVDV